MSVTDLPGHELYSKALSHYRTVLAYGPPGVGKTHAAVNSAVARGEEYVKVTCTDGDMAAEYRGMWVPAGADKFEFFLGVASAAWAELNGGRGGLIVLDEVDHAPPEVHSFLHAILDDPAIASYTLPDKRVIKPGPLFRAVGTMNGVPEDLSPALGDRFQAKVRINEPNPAAIALLPEDLREKAERLITDPSDPVSFRALKAFADSRDILGPDVAAQLVFGSRWNEVITALRLA